MIKKNPWRGLRLNIIMLDKGGADAELERRGLRTGLGKYNPDLGYFGGRHNLCMMQ